MLTPFSINLFQVHFLVGALTGTVVTLFLSRSRGLGMRKPLLVVLLSLPFLFLGSRAFYMLQYESSFSLDSWLGNGMGLLGGLLGFLFVSLPACRIVKLEWSAFLDCLAPGSALGIAIGRVGCFRWGCNGGVPADLPWAVTYSPGYSVFQTQQQQGLIGPFAEASLPVHPTQLYETAFFLAAAGCLYLLFRSKPPAWRIPLAFLGWYTSFRFLIEFIRSDAGGWHPLGLTFSQGVSLLVLGGVLLTALRLSLFQHQVPHQSQLAGR